MKLLFETDSEAVKAAAPEDIFSGIDIRADDESVFNPLGGNNYVYGFTFIFFKTTLGSLNSLHNGHRHQFELQHPFVLKFVPHGDELELYLRAPSVIDPEDEQHYYVDFQDFARATIEASEKFLEFVLDVRPETADHRAIRELEESLESQREWYRETYGEEIE